MSEPTRRHQPASAEVVPSSGSRRLLATTGAVVALALAACGGGRPDAAGTRTSNPPSVTTTTTPTTTTPTTSAPTTSSAPASPAPTDPATSTPTGTATASTTPPATPGAQLPRGGRTIFPRYRLVGYAGAPGSKAFGRLGIGDLDARVVEMQGRAAPYALGRQVLPVLELVTVVANASPGRDGDYNTRVGDATIARYLAAARRHKALLLLNIQPGRDHFMTLVRELRPWLEQPDVGLALDPEWAVSKKQVPGRVFGRTTGAELDDVAEYLDAITRRKHLPQKAMVFHQVAAKVVQGQAAIRRRPGVVVIKSVDGIGSRRAKTGTWRVLTDDLPPSIHSGFKLFFDEDARHGKLMTPTQVLALRPTPEYVLYE